MPRSVIPRRPAVYEVVAGDWGSVSCPLSPLSPKPNILVSVVMDDPDDNRVLECAVTAEADYVVSGDPHLLKPGSYGGIAILTVRKFMDALEAEARIQSDLRG
jgi:hypothetical protein